VPGGFNEKRIRIFLTRFLLSFYRLKKKEPVRLEDEKKKREVSQEVEGDWRPEEGRRKKG
jgi:hypothetical protein